ncbi:MAG: hypothetical protein JWQ11_715 [Rhizobacter sp.]|nr:hypothetical protein [Rhizobacter sp.]
MSDISRRNLMIAGSALAMGVGLAAQQQAQAAGAKGGVLRIVTPEPVMLTGAFNSSGQVYLISGKMFDGLVTYDFDFKPKPQLAESWVLSADGLTLSFKLRGDVKWHDGKPFTSADLAYSAMNVWKVAHPRGRSVYANLEKVDTPDATTAIMRFSKPAPYVMNALAGIESQILPRHLYEGKDLTTNPLNNAPVGNGPFKFVEWQRGQYVKLERNPDYWNKAEPLLDSIIIRFIPDPGARSAAFESGELDAGGSIPVALADAKRLSMKPDLTIPVRGSEALATMSYVEFNMRKAPFNDVRVRRAIAHALDRDFMMKNIWYGFGKPSTGPISSDMAQFYTNKDVPAYKYDLEMAKKLLDEAGLKPGAGGVRFRMTHDPLPGSDFCKGTGDYLRAALQRIGIAVEVRNQDFAGWYKRVYTDYDFDTTNFVAFNLTDPTIGVQRFYWSKNILKGVAFSNGSGYANPEVDKLLESAQVEIDPVKRRAQFAIFQRLAMDDLPNIPIGDINYFTLENKKVKNLILSPYGPHDNFASVSLG